MAIVRARLALLAGIGLLLAACTTPSPGASGTDGGASPDESAFPAAVRSGEPYTPTVDPADFVARVDNPYFPLVPGTRWVLRGSGEAAGEMDEIEVLAETRTVLGVRCTVVRDVVSENGGPVEVTDDWYAQDADGNVWYFGEETAEYANGKRTSTAGSWEAGVDGAQPGVIMPADPRIGLTYRQEYFEGEAEDMAKIVEVGASASVAIGDYADVVVTEDWTPLEPGVRERKSYAPGVGLILERQTSGGESRFELVEHHPGG